MDANHWQTEISRQKAKRAKREAVINSKRKFLTKIIYNIMVDFLIHRTHHLRIALLVTKRFECEGGGQIQ
jgi:hypothetical protein